MDIDVAEDEVDPRVRERALQHIRTSFPWKQYQRQGDTGHVLEDFAVSLLQHVFPGTASRNWTCVVGEDGKMGAVGTFGEDGILRVYVKTECASFLIILFETGVMD